MRLHYDPLGRVFLREFPDGTKRRYYYAGANVIEEFDENSNDRAVHLHAPGVDHVLGSYRWGAAGYTAPLGGYYRLYDSRNNVTHLVNSDSTAAVLETYRYDTFGTPWRYAADGSYIAMGSSPYENRYLFTGREWFPEIGGGPYDYRARLYHPQLGRFLQSDPIGFAGGDGNSYRYCKNDPVNLIDPDGLTVELATRPFDLPGLGLVTSHAFLLITPNVPSDFGLLPGQFFTIGGVANPFSAIALVQGSMLNAEFNNDKDRRAIENGTVQTVQVPTPRGMSDTQFIRALIASVKAFPTNVYTYQIVAMAYMIEIDGKMELFQGYNSNSAVAGILESYGIDSQALFSRLPLAPGSGSPVPLPPAGTRAGGAESGGPTDTGSPSGALEPVGIVQIDGINQPTQSQLDGFLNANPGAMVGPALGGNGTQLRNSS